MSKLAIAVLVIASSVPSFRRAGTTFTDAGKAFPEGYFTEEQLNDIHKEKKLSVREMQSDAIPEGVDTSLISAALTAAAAEKKTPAKKTPAKKTASQTEPTKQTGAKATDKASTTNDTGASA
ncbi:HI1506-related protein [Alteromonas mediterranea]|uniref:HI1506-related protein n=1 Tax=Alteromonas mediterranea TaxID=314275 RepID=UPI00241F2103|nr:HI1506-related protein [Alteromonas mediterranea]